MNRCKSLSAGKLRETFRPFYCIWALLFVVPIAGGCQKGERPTAPVSGAITLNGKPLAGGSIVSQPFAPKGSVIAGKGSVAFCDPDGHFKLETLDGQDGAVIGEHRIRIYGPRVTSVTASDKDVGRAAAPEIVPSKYNHKSELTLTVPPEGTTGANFNLTSK